MFVAWHSQVSISTAKGYWQYVLEMPNRWFGPFFSRLAPKVVSVSRKRDRSWSHFLEQVSPEQDILIYTPEGRMKRKNGLDKNGLPMSVRGGIYDILKKFRGKDMSIFTLY